MPGKANQTRRARWAAILFLMGMAGWVAAEKTGEANSSDGDTRIAIIQKALSRFDPQFTSVSDSSFTFNSDNLRITIKAGDPVFYKGTPFQNGAAQSGVYGSVRVTDKFYGVERVLHYALSGGDVPYGGVQVQEHVTVLFENVLHKPVRPRVFDSKPFVISKDGTFQDRQVMGHFDTPWPENALQILKQELIIESELVATIYIVRTPKSVVLVGYATTPLRLGFPEKQSECFRVGTGNGKSDELI
jgi:hypothetical protein